MRYNALTEKTFNIVKSRLQKTTILNEDYKTVLEKYPDACYFVDPPYFSQDSSYKGFTEEMFIEFLNLIKDKEFVYTDILNEHNKIINNRKFIRDMKSTSPTGAKITRGNLEFLFSSFPIEKHDIEENEW